MEVEPEMEGDPCLASCCQRELKMNKLMRERGENVRSLMPTSLVNRANTSNLEEHRKIDPIRKPEGREYLTENSNSRLECEDERNSSDWDSDDIDA